MRYVFVVENERSKAIVHIVDSAVKAVAAARGAIRGAPRGEKEREAREKENILDLLEQGDEDIVEKLEAGFMCFVDGRSKSYVLTRHSVE